MKLLLRALCAYLAGLLLVGGLLFLPAGTFFWGNAWLFCALLFAPMLILGVVHTGLAYMLFFGAAGKLPAQSTALLSYLDPLLAVVLSAVILHQTMNTPQMIGAGLILGAAFVGEVFGVKKRKR